jgi:hypothetical protein
MTTARVKRELSVAATLVACLLIAPSVRAECFILTAQYVMAEKVFEVVFSGTVLEIVRTSDDGYRATFDVDRVWKGSVSKSIDLYVWDRAGEMPQFVMGRQYLALAHRLIAPGARRDIGLGDTDAVAYAPVTCSGSLATDIIRDLGPGRPPR